MFYSILISDEYKDVLKTAGQLLAPIGLNFLQFSLSLRYYSPRVELFNKVRFQKGLLNSLSFSLLLSI